MEPLELEFTVACSPAHAFDMWSFDAGGGGTVRCMNSNSQNPQLSAANNDKASAVIIYTSSTAC